MKPFLISLRKHKWAVITFSIFLIITIGLLTVQIKNAINVEDSYLFTAYVADTYIPAERRRSGKWPTTLDGLPAFIKAKKEHMPTDESFDDLLGYYRERFDRIEVVKVTGKEFFYRLHTDDRTTSCRSTVNPDGGYCGNAPRSSS